MPKWPQLPHPDIAFDSGGTPASNQFRDIYFSPEDGIAESETVFLDGIGAPECWIDKPVFTIGETGFGTGLNFLLTWNRWRQTAPVGSRLNYVSVEGYPLTAEQLQKALRPFESLSGLTSELVAEYPIRHGGFHRLTFDNGRVSLTLLFGGVETMLGHLTANVDAWFLDGFAPSRNPAMWTDTVFSKIATLSVPKAKIATFTAAGHVRRGLQNAGFVVQKLSGFAHKKERLTGWLDTPPHNNPPTWTSPPKPLAEKSRIAVIGSGIAGSSVAYALRNKGFETIVLDESGKPGGGMIGNPAVILSPKPPVDASLAGRINALAFLHAIRCYDRLRKSGNDVWLNPRGVDALSISQADADRRAEALAALDWPESISKMIEDPSLSAFPIARFSQSGCVDPIAVCRALNATVLGATIDTIEQTEEGWILKGSDGTEWEADAVIVTAGAYSTRLLRLAQMPLHSIRGQISMVEANGLEDTVQSSLSFDGYLSPVLAQGSQDIRVLGASFTVWRNLSDQRWRDPVIDDHDICVSALQNTLSMPTLPQFKPVSHWSGLRAATPDRNPLIGGVADEAQFIETYADMRVGTEKPYPPPHRRGLYILTGLASRGYQLGPLLGDVLADMIAGDPLPIERDLLNAMNPSRFMVRALKRTMI